MRFATLEPNNTTIKAPVLEIPGLNWKKLTLKEARQHKCFIQQEFTRWLEDTDYLFNLRLTHFSPVPVSEWDEQDPGSKVSFSGS